jgi:hypothetical protein
MNIYFTDGEGSPDGEYLDRVRERFKQWIRDTCETPYDEEWLNYQFEIGDRFAHAFYECAGQLFFGVIGPVSSFAPSS